MAMGTAPRLVLCYLAWAGAGAFSFTVTRAGPCITYQPIPGPAAPGRRFLSMAAKPQGGKKKKELVSRGFGAPKDSPLVITRAMAHPPEPLHLLPSLSC